MGKGNVVNDAINGAVNVATWGLVGFDPKKGFEAGGVLHAADEGIGEVTGRNMAREAQNKQTEQLRETEAQAGRDAIDEQLKTYRNDVLASRAAQGIRNSTAARTPGGRAGNYGDTILGDDKDLLGV